MFVGFRNQGRSTVWVATMQWSPISCADYGRFSRQGWWGVAPGQLIFTTFTFNRYFYYYAESETGSVWQGPFGTTVHPWEAFDECIGLGVSTFISVGMREKDLGWAAAGPGTYIINLRH